MSEWVERRSCLATAVKLPLVLADVGALEGLKPGAAGAAIAGARVAMEVDHDGARVSRDDIIRLTEILETLRKDQRRVDPRPPPRALKIYEEHINLRKIFFKFCVFGQSPATANANTKRLHATWQQSLIDADAAACRERFEPYTGLKGKKPGDPEMLEGMDAFILPHVYSAIQPTPPKTLVCRFNCFNPLAARVRLAVKTTASMPQSRPHSGKIRRKLNVD